MKQIRNHLVEFYLECEKRLAAYKMNTLKINLSKRECTYIKCQYEGVDTKIIKERLGNIPLNKLVELKRSIFNKLEVYNWFNTFKIAFQLNILDKSPYQGKNLDMEVKHSQVNLSRLKSLRRMKPNEKKLAVFAELTRLYLAVEYSYLLKKQAQKS